jgi:DNA recombination protein RmuC
MTSDTVLVAAAAFAAGALVAWALTNGARARLAAERDAATRRAEDLMQGGQQLRESFRALGSDVLRENSESFLRLARGELERVATGAQASLTERERAIAALVEPIRAGLAQYDDRVLQLERDRAQHYGQLAQRLDEVSGASARLLGETQNLVKALRAPAVRGTWGELQLRRVCELAGMLEHCDFVTQQSVEGSGGRLRPDLVISLPGGRTIVVDAKTPLGAYLDALECTDDIQRAQLLRDHARQVRGHIDLLSRKEYWQHFERSPEFVVLFLPGESFFSAALSADPALIEGGITDGVILATPSTLMALLKTVSFSWREDRLSRNAEEIRDAGRDLYERMAVLVGHFAELGAGITRAADAYNAAIGSMERRVMPAARRLKDLGAASPDAEMPAPVLVERGVRTHVTPRDARLPNEDRPEGPDSGPAAG